MKRLLVAICLTFAAFVPSPALRAADQPTFSQKEVIYGRKDGTALTLDVFSPAKGANGAGIIVVVSGGWRSSHDSVNTGLAAPYLARGYTVFTVVHGSNPRYAIDEILGDMHRAVRFIRTNAKGYGIDAERLGIVGASAGGHLSLMQGCAGSAGSAKAEDLVERASSRVQAVVAFFPPTDFLNWGEEGKVMLGKNAQIPIFGAFDFRRFDTKLGALVPITDDGERLEIGKKISPITHVNKSAPPTLLVHGDADPLVPLQQSERMAKALKNAGATADLIVMKGGKHDGALIKEHMPRAVEWFDKHLARKAEAAGGQE
jgi:acetyl esterase/lipase